jgi:hypothetical protein
MEAWAMPKHGGSTVKTASVAMAFLLVVCLAVSLAACGGGGGEGGGPTSAGDKIAFASGRDGKYEIYVMNADGSGQTRLTDNPAIEGVAA